MWIFPLDPPPINRSVLNEKISISFYVDGFIGGFLVGWVYNYLLPRAEWPEREYFAHISRGFPLP